MLNGYLRYHLEKKANEHKKKNKYIYDMFKNSNGNVIDTRARTAAIKKLLRTTKIYH